MKAAQTIKRADPDLTFTGGKPDHVLPQLQFKAQRGKQLHNHQRLTKGDRTSPIVLHRMCKKEFKGQSRLERQLASARGWTSRKLYWFEPHLT